MKTLLLLSPNQLLLSSSDQLVSNTMIIQYQVLLLDPPTKALNLATFLPNKSLGSVKHYCLENMGTLTGMWEDINDCPLTNEDARLFTDGSSYIEDGVRCAGVVMVTPNWVIWAQALGHLSLAQKCELIVLPQALQWAKGKNYQNSTDSCYAFAVG